MFEHLENFDLPHSSFFDDLVFLRFFEFFDGHDISIIVALAFKNDSIGSLAYHAHNIILLHINFYHYNSLTINFNQILDKPIYELKILFISNLFPSFLELPIRLSDGLLFKI